MRLTLGTTIFIFIIILLVFNFGLILGGKIFKNGLPAKMETLKQMLMAHKASVVIVDGSLANALSFKPRKHDLDMRKLSFAGAGDNTKQTLSFHGSTGESSPEGER
jgi:hypothetical protein